MSKGRTDRWARKRCDAARTVESYQTRYIVIYQELVRVDSANHKRIGEESIVEALHNHLVLPSRMIHATGNKGGVKWSFMQLPFHSLPLRTLCYPS